MKTCKKHKFKRSAITCAKTKAINVADFMEFVFKKYYYEE